MNEIVCLGIPYCLLLFFFQFPLDKQLILKCLLKHEMRYCEVSSYFWWCVHEICVFIFEKRSAIDREKEIVKNAETRNIFHFLMSSCFKRISKSSWEMTSFRVQNYCAIYIHTHIYGGALTASICSLSPSLSHIYC